MPALARVKMWFSLKIVPRKSTTKVAVMRRSSGSSFDMVSFLILIGRMTAPMPIRRRMFKMLLPMTLPRSTSEVLLRSEANETASSGALVPKATMVSPMRSLETLKCEAAEDAPSIIQSAPLIKMTKPTMRSIICRKMSIMFISLVVMV